MARWICLPVAAAALLASCFPDRHSPVGLRCETDADCGSGLLCVAAACRSSFPQGKWAEGPALPAEFSYAQAVALPDGRVLLAGGSVGGQSSAHVALYDPSSGEVRLVHDMGAARSSFTLTLLPDGRALAAGGEGSPDPLNSAEIYDPATDRWTPTSAMGHGPADGFAFVLPGLNKVAVFGTRASQRVQLLDLASGQWTEGASADAFYYSNVAVQLADGRIFASSVGGTQVYSGATDSWSPRVAGTSTQYNQAAALLPSGRVLVAGGHDDSGVSSSAAEFDPQSSNWSTVAHLLQAREDHNAARLVDGRVLMVGGLGNGSSGEVSLATTELYSPDSRTWSPGPTLLKPRNGPILVMFKDGSVWVAGGLSDGTPQTSSELLKP